MEGGFQGISEGEHVNIMGNVDMIRDVLKIVTGHGDAVEERISSDLPAIVRKVDENRLKSTKRGGGRRLHRNKAGF